MTAALEGGEWSAARPGRTLPPGKTRYPSHRRLGGPQGWSGRVENLVPTGIWSQTVQPVVIRYTDWATGPIVKNIDEYISNSAVHSINTQHSSDLHPPSIKLTKYKKGVYYSVIKIFSHLPQTIKNLSWNVKKFKLALKKFILMGSFYTLDEYFDWIYRSDLGTFR